MGFRFRRSVRIMPGVRLNFSTRGVSTSIGGRGATLNLSRRGARATVGIPGTGLSYTTKLSGPPRAAGATLPQPASPVPPSTAQGSLLPGLLVLGGALLALGMCVSGQSGTADPIAAPSPEAVPVPVSRTVTGDAVNCRAAPAKTGAVISKLHKGETGSVLDQSAGWTKLGRPSDDCWVADTLLSDS